MAVFRLAADVPGLIAIVVLIRGSAFFASTI